MANILLIVSGGIAAYKACEIIRLARQNGHRVTPVLTKGGAEFITPLTLSALAEQQTYTDLFSLKDETEMGHIRLARDADIIVIAPCSANMMAKMASGRSDDLASTVLLAAQHIPILIAPAMNPAMWADAATQDNLKILEQRGVHKIGPANGEMACGEHGEGRMSEPADIVTRIDEIFGLTRPLKGLHAIVTSGPTHEPLDPVRFLGNRSSGKQGHAIAEQLIRAGASVTLITGPVILSDPEGATTIHVETAQEMYDAVHNALPADVFIAAAAVADWRANPLAHKHKKNSDTWTLTLTQTPDILAGVAGLPNDKRPSRVIGFALESENALQNAQTKRVRKNADALLVNGVSDSASPFGAESNKLIWLDAQGTDDWGAATKTDHAAHLVQKLIELKDQKP